MTLDFGRLAHRFDEVMADPGYPLEPDLPQEEYQLRLRRARARMELEGLDALVVTSSTVGKWFTGRFEPNEWHDQCQSRANFFIITGDRDVLLMAPTVGGERLNTARRATWVTEIRGLTERSRPPRSELWNLEQIPSFLNEVGLGRARLGFELGDHMMLGMNVQDLRALEAAMPDAALVDGSPAIRWLMSVLTPFEVERLRAACVAGVYMHDRTTLQLHEARTERDLLDRLVEDFKAAYTGPDYDYQPAGGWDMRNIDGRNGHPYHDVVTDRPLVGGDLVFRGWSGVGFAGYRADIDRDWFIGRAPQRVFDLYRMTWEANRAMAAAIRPGVRCADVYEAGARVEAQHGRPPRETGRTGHGLRNVGGLSVYPGCTTILEPGMVLSVEPIFNTDIGFFDLEDQYLVTETGAECLHEPAPESMPMIS